MRVTSIPLASLSDQEKATILFLRRLEFPKDRDLFMMLPLALIKQWLYGLDPKVAIVVSCDPEFKRMFKFKQEQSWVGHIFDWMIRRVHGLDF